MNRIKPVDRNTSDESARKTFEAVNTQLGMVPIMIRTMAVAPAVVEGYLCFSDALRRGTLPHALQEQLAIAIADANACEYCLSAHTALGRRAGVADEELQANRTGQSSDPKVDAALTFALVVLERRGGVSDETLAAIRAAGFSDREIAEIVAHVALNVFTNYFNRVAGTEIDFPRVTSRPVARVSI